MEDAGIPTTKTNDIVNLGSCPQATASKGGDPPLDVRQGDDHVPPILTKYVGKRFVSSDPKENEDNESPEWETLRNLRFVAFLKTTKKNI